MEKYLPIKFLTVLCFLGVVISYSEIEKRDLHRIILKDRRPRSHRSHNHRHHHKHQHDFGSYENYGKHDKHNEYDHIDHYGSQESSYEEVPMLKYKSYHHSHHKVPKTKPYYSSAEYEDSKVEPYLSSESHFDFDHKTRRRPRKESKGYSSPLDIELTTKYPTTSPYYSFFDNTDFSNFNFNQKNLDLRQPPPVASGYNFNNSYQVRENNYHDERDYRKDQGFEVLGPTLAITKYLASEESNVRQHAVEDEDSVKQWKNTNGRRQGRRVRVKN